MADSDTSGEFGMDWGSKHAWP